MSALEGHSNSSVGMQTICYFKAQAFALSANSRSK